MITRREMLKSAAVIGGAALVGDIAFASEEKEQSLGFSPISHKDKLTLTVERYSRGNQWECSDYYYAADGLPYRDSEKILSILYGLYRSRDLKMSNWLDEVCSKFKRGGYSIWVDNFKFDTAVAESRGISNESLKGAAFNFLKVGRDSAVRTAHSKFNKTITFKLNSGFYYKCALLEEYVQRLTSGSSLEHCRFEILEAGGE